MNKFALAFAVTLLLFTGATAAPKNKTFTGEIMDSQCSQMGNHDGMMKMHENIKTSKDCTLGCVKNGGKFVLFNATDKTVYQLDDQKKPVAFAGAKVRVTGTLDSTTKTIHVAGIKSASY